METRLQRKIQRVREAHLSKQKEKEEEEESEEEEEEEEENSQEVSSQEDISSRPEDPVQEVYERLQRLSADERQELNVLLTGQGLARQPPTTRLTSGPVIGSTVRPATGQASGQASGHHAPHPGPSIPSSPTRSALC